jgi:hypothetical protein
MRKKISIVPMLVTALFVLCGFCISTAPAFADPWAPGQPGTPATPVPGANPPPTTVVPGANPPPPQSLKNPLTVNSIGDLLKLILQIVIIFAIPIIVFFIIYSGFLYVTAQGKPDQITKATKAFTWTIIGAVIVLGAQLLLIVITNTVRALM